MPVTRKSRRALGSNDRTEDAPPPSFSGALDEFQHGAQDKKAIVTKSNTPGPIVSVTPHESTSLKRGVPVDETVEAVRTPSPAKKRRASSKYAPPSKYAHLKGLQDILEPGLIAIFVGFNPGVRTAQTGHPYAHPSNHFWRLLHSSGLTDRRWRPDEAPKLPEIGLGNTNLVDRPTKDTAELSKDERAAGAPILAAKVKEFKPEAVCIVGKSIWEDIWRYKYGRNPKPSEFKYGWQNSEENIGTDKLRAAMTGEEAWPGARVFVTTSTSGLSASLKPAEKEAIWKPFGDWVQQRRRERGQ